MSYISMTDILTLWELQSANVVQAQSLSNFLFIAYAIAWFINKEGRYIAAFLLDEVLSNVSYLDVLSDSQYYLMVCVIYSTLYWYIESKNIRLKTIVACGIIVLFNAGMSFDAFINSEVETIMYTYYIHFVVLLHLYLISTLIRWSLVGKSLGRCITNLWRVTGFSDAFTFIWYNSIIIKN